MIIGNKSYIVAPGLFVLDGADGCRQNCVSISGTDFALADWNCGCTRANYACEFEGEMATMAPTTAPSATTMASIAPTTASPTTMAPTAPATTASPITMTPAAPATTAN